jgi:type IV pilus assembly protein PilB
MNDKLLLDTLVQKGIISQDVAERVARDTFLTKKTAEEILHERLLADDAAVLAVKSELLGIPSTKIDPEKLSEELKTIISEETARSYKVVPISRSKEMLVVGMVRPDDTKAQDALRFIAKKLGVNLGVYLISLGDLDAALRKYSPYKDEIEAALAFLKKGGKAGTSGMRIMELEGGISVAEEAPIVKIVASTLKEAVARQASDIHIEPSRTRLRIRMRIDGELEEVSSIPAELHQAIISRIKVLSDLKIDEQRIPQDGRFRSVIFGRDIDFRVATFPTPAGEKAAIRVLDPTVGLKSMETLGLSDYNLKIVEEGLNRPFGMILITGPTGSGKTTTLYALLQRQNTDDVNIVSLEDPVEYYVEGLNQSQVRPEIGYDFASGLRQILRQDPDIIMVGEIRDNETAGLAVHAALTGHIVLSTLHTNNALGVIPRLIDMKVDSFLLPPSLNLMASQRLVSKLCPNCKKAEKPSAALESIIKKEYDNLPQILKERVELPFRIWHGEGCAKCRGRGILGRIALFEVFRMTPELSEIIASGWSERKLVEEAKRQGMVTLRQDGILKALQGEVLIEEVLRETAEI